MSKISIQLNSLKRNGKSRSIKLADAHNTRKIATEYGPYGSIDASRIPLNLELIRLKGVPLEVAVDETLNSLGIDINNPRIRAKNRGLATEAIFTVTAGHKCDYNALYSDCLGWVRTYYPECPILYAVIHHDEDTPHMHVIFVPISDGKLQADKIRGYKGISRSRESSLVNFLHPKYGLSPIPYLQKANKKAGVNLALELTRAILDSAPLTPIKEVVMKSIAARPEPYLQAMGISYSMLQEHLRQHVLSK